MKMMPRQLYMAWFCPFLILICITDNLHFTSKHSRNMKLNLRRNASKWKRKFPLYQLSHSSWFKSWKRKKTWQISALILSFFLFLPTSTWQTKEKTAKGEKSSPLTHFDCWKGKGWKEKRKLLWRVVQGKKKKIKM